MLPGSWVENEKVGSQDESGAASGSSAIIGQVAIRCWMPSHVRKRRSGEG